MEKNPAGNDDCGLSDESCRNVLASSFQAQQICGLCSQWSIGEFFTHYLIT